MENYSAFTKKKKTCDDNRLTKAYDVNYCTGGIFTIPQEIVLKNLIVILHYCSTTYRILFVVFILRRWGLNYSHTFPLLT